MPFPGEPVFPRYDYPCKGCDKREVGCHSVCEKYLAAQAANDKRRKDVRRIAKAQDDYDDYKQGVLHHIRERSRRRK